MGDIMKPLKEKISITIDGDLLEKARTEAELDDRSLSQYINIALRYYLKRGQPAAEPTSCSQKSVQ